MKLLIIPTLLILLCGCSKKQEEPKPPVEERVSENPQSNYGKAIKKTDDLTKQIEKDRAEADAMFEE